MNWSVYNQYLVRRGEILLGFDVINNWAYRAKRYEQRQGLRAISLSEYFSSSPRICQGILSSTIQTAEGITKAHAKGKVPLMPHSTTINRRINRQDIKMNDNKISKELEDDYIVIAIDSTGIKVTNRGQWIRDKLGIRKSYLKIHIAVNAKTKKILSIMLCWMIIFFAI